MVQARTVGAVVAVVLALSPASSPAQKEPTRREKAAARAHFERGEAHYRAARYDEAIEEYRAAYDLAGLAPLLFNIAQAYRLKGDRREALEHYRAFLEQAPPGHQLGPEARQHVAALEEALAAERRNEEPPREPSEPSEPGKPSEPREVRGGPAPEVSKEAPAGGNRTLRIAGLVTAGAGVVGLGLGVKFGLDAKGADDALTRHKEGPWTDELLARHREGERAERRMMISLGVGALAVVAGGVLYYYGESRGGAEARVSFVPAVGGSPALVSLSGGF